jgi:FkbM family methyltransferase
MSASTTIEFPEDGFNTLTIGRHGPVLFNRHDAYIGPSLSKYGEYSRAEAVVFAQLVQPGMTVVEAGANIGSHTIQLARLAGPQGRVVVFEPERLTFQTLCANIALNSLANVYAFPVGLSDTPGEARESWVDPNVHNNFGGIGLAGALDETPSLRRVPVRTLDSFALPACGFLKIDVEGMESAVLRGAKETIARHRPVMVVENDRKSRSHELITILFEYGYACYWWYPALYAADNFRSDPENLFPGLCSPTLLCCPEELRLVVPGLKRVTGPDDIGSDIWTVEPE